MLFLQCCDRVLYLDFKLLFKEYNVIAFSHVLIIYTFYSPSCLIPALPHSFLASFFLSISPVKFIFCIPLFCLVLLSFLMLFYLLLILLLFFLYLPLYSSPLLDPSSSFVCLSSLFNFPIPMSSAGRSYRVQHKALDGQWTAFDAVTSPLLLCKSVWQCECVKDKLHLAPVKSLENVLFPHIGVLFFGGGGCFLFCFVLLLNAVMQAIKKKN